MDDNARTETSAAPTDSPATLPMEPVAAAPGAAAGNTPPATDAAPESGPLRRRLGRGLNALLGPGATGESRKPAADEPGGDLRMIPVDLIDRNPYQPRREFKPEAITELSQSIRQHGVLQPLLVRSHGPRFQLIAGERRLLASKEAGLATVPVRVMDLVDQEVSEAALEENLKREDLGALEKAQAFQDYIDKFGTSIEEVGRKFSMSRSAVSNLLRLQELPEAVKKALRADKITSGHARALLSLSESDQVALCKRIQQEQLSVRKTEEAVKEILGRDPNVIPISEGMRKAKPSVNNHLLSVQQQLRDALGLKVEIKAKDGEQAGKVTIPFENNDEFERIVQLIRKSAA